MRHHYAAMLAAPAVGLVHGSECKNREVAATLLADRIANGEAFTGERVVRVPRRIVQQRRAAAWLKGDR